MSTALGIASVTQVLSDLLNNSLITNDAAGVIGANVEVTILAPDKVPMETEANQLNLFMYQATFNQGWRNLGQPVMNSDGERLTNPPLPLDLHYLLTAYGPSVLNTDILLGFGMQTFHETPVLVRDFIRTSLASSTITALATSGLAEQIEQIKITPELLSIEDISKLWAAFQTGHYRPTAAYKATVVLIEGRRSARSTLPVRQRNIYVIPFEPPLIEKIKSRTRPGQPILENQKILSDHILVIEGKRLRNEVTEISIDSDFTITSLDSINDSEISFRLPAGLRAGLHAVQIVHPIMMGSPPAAHKGAASNTEGFVLSPRIVNLQPVAGTSSIRLDISPAISDTQRVVLLLNEINTPGPAHSYSFLVEMTPLSPPGTTTRLTIPVNGAVAGTYVVRIQVDGAESQLLSNTAGQFISPQVTI